MREIRFRAFYKPRGLMLNVLSIDFINQWLEMECPYEDLEGGDNISAMFHEIELMQYTGVKDKNGVEIYEGDIFRPGPSYNERSFRVNWEDEDARFLGIGCGKDSERVPGEKYVCYVGVYNKLKNNTVEVIGNIYENPELLGEDKNA